MVRRRSWPPDDKYDLPLFTPGSATRTKDEHNLPLFTTRTGSIETRADYTKKHSTTKRGNESINVLWKSIAAAFVLFGFVTGSIINNKGYRYMEQLSIFQKVAKDTNTLQQSDSIEDVILPSVPVQVDHNPMAGTSEFQIVEDFPPFVVQKPREYEMAPIHWPSNGKQVDKHARVVGLPTILTRELEKFCVDIGLGNLLHWAARSDDLEINQTVIAGAAHLKNGNEWAITRTGHDKVNTNLHWFHTNDEKSYEATVDILRKGNFDYVLNTIASEFKPWGYMFAGMGFTVGSHSEASFIGPETPGAGKNLLKLVFPIHMPNQKTARMYVGSDEDKMVAPLELNYHEALLLSGDTIHGTADFDYRKYEDMQILASIYIADIHTDNIDIISESNRALSPFSRNHDWLMAQRGRFWGGIHGGSFEFDRGRQPYQPKDQLHNCHDLANRGLCLEISSLKEDPGLWDIRKFCPKSCGIFIDDVTYFSQVPRPQRQPERDIIGL